MFNFHKADDKGFTLIELLIVIAIIGILAAIAVPVFVAQNTNANLAAAEAQASALNTLVAGNLAVAGSVGTVTNDVTYDGAIGDMTVTDGTIAITGTTAADYCVSSTVGGQTASYGPCPTP